MNEEFISIDRTLRTMLLVLVGIMLSPVLERIWRKLQDFYYSYIKEPYDKWQMEKEKKLIIKEDIKFRKNNPDNDIVKHFNAYYKGNNPYTKCTKYERKNHE